MSAALQAQQKLVQSWRISIISERSAEKILSAVWWGHFMAKSEHVIIWEMLRQLQLRM